MPDLLENAEIERPKYDAWLNWGLLSNCNLKCPYCSAHPASSLKKNLWQLALEFIRLLKKRTIGLSSWPLYTSKFSSRPSPKDFAIDITALLDVLERARKIFRINFAGNGEPFLVPNIVEACEQLTRNHFVSMNTNLTPKSVLGFCDRIDPARVVLIYASLHIKELERLGLTETFIRHFHLFKTKGFRILARGVAYPPLLKEIEKYKEFFRKEGIELKFGRYDGEYEGREYPAAYTQEELQAFGLENAPDLRSCQRGTLCNAGYNAAVVWPDGAVVLCLNVIEKLGHIYEGIRFKERMIRCPSPYCTCPAHFYDTGLYEKALRENKVLENTTPLGTQA